ncbi:oxidoreductase [Leucosporidium creatinivorum]|uniref:Oxidoreductase n=1 Tax=Leucosporidium creatinivorum TaxID=106004 RepID=A0A1Y2DML3_9BASI|nr:oxidoreductase [Leucosporidium creatinivorum]
MSSNPSFNASTSADEAASALASEILGKHVLITGVSPGGLGAEAARAIAQHSPALLILAGRSQAKIDETAAAIKKESPSTKLRPLVLDLSSLAAVRKAAEEVNSWPEPIDVLINNAAIMANPRRELTVDGFESQFATNHLGHFLFTNLIYPRLSSSSSGPRIVNVSSRGHRRSAIRFEDFNFAEEGSYVPFVAYGQAKTANMLFSVELTKRWASIGATSFSLHPGVIYTNLARLMSEEEKRAMGINTETGETQSTVFEWKTLPQGAATHIVAAFDPNIAEQSGSYLDDCQLANQNAESYALDEESESNAERLWKLSEELVGDQFE